MLLIVLLHLLVLSNYFKTLSLREMTMDNSIVRTIHRYEFREFGELDWGPVSLGEPPPTTQLLDCRLFT